MFRYIGALALILSHTAYASEQLSKTPFDQRVADSIGSPLKRVLESRDSLFFVYEQYLKLLNNILPMDDSTHTHVEHMVFENAKKNVRALMVDSHTFLAHCATLPTKLQKKSCDLIESISKYKDVAQQEDAELESCFKKNEHGKEYIDLIEYAQLIDQRAQRSVNAESLFEQMNNNVASIDKIANRIDDEIIEHSIKIDNYLIDLIMQGQAIADEGNALAIKVKETATKTQFSYAQRSIALRKLKSFHYWADRLYTIKAAICSFFKTVGSHSYFSSYFTPTGFDDRNIYIQKERDSLEQAKHLIERLTSEIVQSNLLCALCGKKSNASCSQCGTTRYCSKECQKSHWKKHKPTCHFDTNKIIDFRNEDETFCYDQHGSQYKITIRPVGDREMITLRDIKTDDMYVITNIEDQTYAHDLKRNRLYEVTHSFRFFPSKSQGSQKTEIKH